jgi:hypothetical protein
MAGRNSNNQSLVSKPLIEDLIVEAAPELERSKPRAFKRVYAVLQVCVDSVANACRDVTKLPGVIADERQRAATGGPVCVGAFDIFVKNLELEC